MNTENLKRTGGESRQKIELDEIKKEAKKELLEIEAMTTNQSAKTKRFTRLARKIKNELRGDKRKFFNKKTGKYDTNKQIALSTYHSYLTQIRNTLKMLDIKHHSLPSKIATLSKRYPEYSDLLASILNEPARSVGAVKAHVLKQVQSDKEGTKRAQAYKAIKALKVDHDVVTRLVKDDIEIADRADNENKKLAEKKQNTVTLNYCNIERMISELIKDKAYSKRALGLALASGRRATEILYTANFKLIDDNKVMFSGQTKKRYGTLVGSYEIYTLIPAPEFVAAFHEFRAMDTVKEIHTDTKELEQHKQNKYINSRTAKTLNETTKREFKDKKRTFKDSRGIYTRVCLDTFFGSDSKWDHKDEDEFLKSLLGHSDYKDQRNYKQFKIDYDAQIQQEKAPTKAIVSENHLNPLNAIDDNVAATRRKPMIALHERVKAWAANNPEWKLSQTVMTKAKGVGKIGGSRPLIKDYLVLAEHAINQYNADK